MIWSPRHGLYIQTSFQVRRIVSKHFELRLVVSAWSGWSRRNMRAQPQLSGRPNALPRSGISYRNLTPLLARPLVLCGLWRMVCVYLLTLGSEQAAMFIRLRSRFCTSPCIIFTEYGSVTKWVHSLLHHKLSKWPASISKEIGRRWRIIHNTNEA